MGQCSLSSTLERLQSNTNDNLEGDTERTISSPTSDCIVQENKQNIIMGPEMNRKGERLRYQEQAAGTFRSWRILCWSRDPYRSSDFIGGRNQEYQFTTQRLPLGVESPGLGDRGIDTTYFGSSLFLGSAIFELC